MKMKRALRIVIGVFVASSALGGSPVSKIQVTLRGKKYEVSDVATVAELQEKVKEESGIEVKKQGRLLFDGRRLSSSDVLSDVGVADGSQLNLVPGKAKGSKGSSSSSGPASPAKTSSEGTPSSEGNFMENMMKQAGVDPSQMEELMKKMPADGKMPDMKDSMEMMQGMLNSPLFQQYMSDPESLEQSRQMILQNPMLKSMMAGMPGMEEILNDKDAWREAMQAAANMYKNMNPEDLVKAMETMDGSGKSPIGDRATAAALDELSEGDD